MDPTNITALTKNPLRKCWMDRVIEYEVHLWILLKVYHCQLSFLFPLLNVGSHSPGCSMCHVVLAGPFVIICHQQHRDSWWPHQQHNNNLRPEKYLTPEVRLSSVNKWSVEVTRNILKVFLASDFSNKWDIEIYLKELGQYKYYCAGQMK